MLDAADKIFIVYEIVTIDMAVFSDQLLHCKYMYNMCGGQWTDSCQHHSHTASSTPS